MRRMIACTFAVLGLAMTSPIALAQSAVKEGEKVLQGTNPSATPAVPGGAAGGAGSAAAADKGDGGPKPAITLDPNSQPPTTPPPTPVPGNPTAASGGPVSTPKPAVALDPNSQPPTTPVPSNPTAVSDASASPGCPGLSTPVVSGFPQPEVRRSLKGVTSTTLHACISTNR